MKVPSTFVKGVTLTWTESLSDYPAPSWVLSYTFINPSNKIEITADPLGADHQISAPTSITQNFSPGRYDWQAFVSDGSNRHCVGTGYITVIEDFASVTQHDGRSVLRQTVEAIDAYLLGNATNEQQKRRYKEREIWNHSREELILLREKLGRELAAEERRTGDVQKGSVIRAVIR